MIDVIGWNGSSDGLNWLDWLGALKAGSSEGLNWNWMCKSWRLGWKRKRKDGGKAVAFIVFNENGQQWIMRSKFEKI